MSKLPCQGTVKPHAAFCRIELIYVACECLESIKYQDCKATGRIVTLKGYRSQIPDDLIAVECIELENH